MRKLRNISNRQVLLILIAVAVGSSMASLVFHGEWDSAWLDGWFQNFSTEVFGALMTFGLLELLVGGRQERERLIRQMGSKTNETAVAAAVELQAHGWLEDGSLEKVNLWGASLEGANLVNANLAEALLGGANLAGAFLDFASLEGANFMNANLARATLFKANMEGTILMRADLREAGLQRVELNEETILPDGTYWKEGTDMERFTDPEHDDFWRSSDPDSPAYGGKRKDEENPQ